MQNLAVRSLLFVPGDNEKLIEKAVASQADAVIVDLEDAVAPENKSRAREVCHAALSARGDDAKPVSVRANALDTGETAHDLAAVMSAAPSGIMLPKCQSMAEVTRHSHHLKRLRHATVLRSAVPGS